jgi:hypothetical protein
MVKTTIDAKAKKATKAPKAPTKPYCYICKKKPSLDRKKCITSICEFPCMKGNKYCFVCSQLMRKIEKQKKNYREKSNISQDLDIKCEKNCNVNTRGHPYCCIYLSSFYELREKQEEEKYKYCRNCLYECYHTGLDDFAPEINDL